MGMQWSPQQNQALDEVGDWLEKASKIKDFKQSDVPQVYYLAGYAGTGKTTLARHLAKKRQPVYMALSGKAAVVMRKSGCKGASTIHSTIYKSKRNEITGKYRTTFDAGGACKCAGIIIIDEISMVGDKVGQDILRYNKPVLVLGDPAQLPPIKSGGFFTSREPNIMLTEIHRQAEGNPIIRLATEVRNGGVPDFGNYGQSSVIRKGDLSPDIITAADQVLVGINRTRQLYNARIRVLKAIESELPIIGDRLVCLKNDYGCNIFNGGIYNVEKLHDDPDDGRCVKFTVKSEDFPDSDFVESEVRREFFTDEKPDIFWKELLGQQQYTYGYALTVHKAQGSQWDNVVLLDQSGAFGDMWWRWLYTGITRAAEQITIVR